MVCCHEHFEMFRSMPYQETQALHDVCADCMAATKKRNDEIQQTCTIDPTRRYGEHIALTCVNHPDLRWTTKNIDFIGARSIFFAGEVIVDEHGDKISSECSCSGRDLILVAS